MPVFLIDDASNHAYPEKRPPPKGGGPDRTRTCDLRFRKPLLYPAELRDPQSDINTLTHQLSVQNGTLPPTYRRGRRARNVNARGGGLHAGERNAGRGEPTLARPRVH